MAQESQGINQLLAAEEEANQIIRAAREARAERLRQAEVEAQKAMEDERARLERELKNDPELVDTSYSKFAAELESKTRAEIETIQASYDKNKGNVLALLLHHVTHVQLECSEAMKQAVLTKDREAQADARP